MSEIVAGILAGGESRRMGRPKALLAMRDGRAMIEHVIDAVGSVGAQTFLLGETEGWAPPAERNVRVLIDRQPGLGPMSGIVTLMSEVPAAGYLIVCCDQPFLRPDLLERLRDALGDRPVFFSDTDGARLDPFPGLFPTSLHTPAIDYLNDGGRSVREFVARHSPHYVNIVGDEIDSLRNINTPEQYGEALKSANDTKLRD